MGAGPTPEESKEAAEALIEIAALLDGLEVAAGSRVELAVAGLILRARRFAVAACRLADAGDLGEAGAFVRALMEYTVTLRWLLLDPPRHFTIWAIDDLRGRLLIAEAGERLAGVELLGPEMRTRYEETRAALEEEWRETIGDPVPRRMPSLERRARETGNQLLYEFAYRFESQTGIHPTPFAVDQMLSESGDHVKLSATPVRASYADPYGVVAVALLDMLDAATGGALPDLDLDDQIAPYREILNSWATTNGGEHG